MLPANLQHQKKTAKKRFTERIKRVIIIIERDKEQNIMTATEKTAFDSVLENFAETYPEVKIEHPHNDSYMLFTVNGEAIGGFNPEGFCLLHCLSQLTKIYIAFKLR